MRLVILFFLFVSTASLQEDWLSWMLIRAEEHWGQHKSVSIKFSTNHKFPQFAMDSCNYGKTNFGGIFDALTNEILLNPYCAFQPTGLSGIETFRIIEHEYGHALGVVHSSNYNSVMYWKADGQERSITKEDLFKVNLNLTSEELAQILNEK